MTGSLLYLAMPYDQGRSGISEYIRSTLKEISQTKVVHLVALKSDLPTLESCLAPGQHRITGLADFWGQPVFSLLWFLLILPLQLRQWQPESVFAPAGNRRLVLGAPCPLLTTIHDLAPLRLRKKYDPLRQFYLTQIWPRMLKQAGSLLAISQQTADDLVELAGIDKKKIIIAPNGYDPTRFHPHTEAEDAERLAKYGLAPNSQKPYLLYVARIEHPGKNHLGLLTAWMALPAALRQSHTLVLAGSDWKGAEVVHDWVARHQPENVRFTGFVPEGDLPALYRHAKLYLQPSLYEGFGLPLVEAMASGVPVLCSQRGALPEIGAEAVRYFDPAQPEALVTALTELLQQAPARAQLIQKGFQRALDFSWKEHATKILAPLTAPAYLRLQGLKLRNAHLPEVLQELGERIRTRTLTRLFYVNADCLNLAWQNRAYRSALNGADLLLPDGSGVALGARMTGQNLLENLNGTDMFVPLCEQALAQGWRVWFLGGRPEVNMGLVQSLQARWPGLQIVGHHHGYFAPEDEPALLEQIRVDQPDLLFVAMGAPQQELWISTYAETLGVPVLLGVGGLFDFYSGRIPRAPQWLRRLGLEWSWRLLQEPLRLWRRYLIGNPLFVLRMLRSGKGAPSSL